MVIGYLVAMSFIAVVNICVFTYLYGKQHCSFFVAYFYCIIIANFGHLFMGLSTTLEGVLLANKACYLGSCFAPLVLIFLMFQLCNFRFPRWAKLLLASFSFVVFCLSCTVGWSDIYYKSAQFVVLDGVGCYTAEYGPAHVLWNVLLIIYIITGFSIIGYAAKVKRNVSYKCLTALFVVQFLTIVAFFTSRYFDNDSIVMPFFYVLSSFVLLYVCVHVKMYNLEHCILDSLIHANDCAYIGFSPKGNYFGCNDIATKFFPELADYRVDHALPESGGIADIFKKWMDDFSKGNVLQEDHFEYRGKFFKMTEKHFQHSGQSTIFLFCIEDETKTRLHISQLGSQKLKLENELNLNRNQLVALQKQTINGMAKIVESRDANTGGHISRTSHVVQILVEEMQKDPALQYSSDFYQTVIEAAPVHDIGKMAVDDSILRKQGRFTDEEFEKMKIHAEKGSAIVDNLFSDIESPFFVEIAKNVACSHHERWNGNGYPQGLGGERIPFEARIMAVADVYDALVSKRCYKDRMSFDDAFNYIVGAMGSHFDPALKPYFINCRERLEAYYNSVEH